MVAGPHRVVAVPAVGEALGRPDLVEVAHQARGTQPVLRLGVAGLVLEPHPTTAQSPTTTAGLRVEVPLRVGLPTAILAEVGPRPVSPVADEAQDQAVGRTTSSQLQASVVVRGLVTARPTARQIGTPPQVAVDAAPQPADQQPPVHEERAERREVTSLLEDAPALPGQRPLPQVEEAELQLQRLAAQGPFSGPAAAQAMGIAARNDQRQLGLEAVDAVVLQTTQLGGREAGWPHTQPRAVANVVAHKSKGDTVHEGPPHVVVPLGQPPDMVQQEPADGARHRRLNEAAVAKPDHPRQHQEGVLGRAVEEEAHPRTALGLQGNTGEVPRPNLPGVGPQRPHPGRPATDRVAVVSSYPSFGPEKPPAAAVGAARVAHPQVPTILAKVPATPRTAWEAAKAATDRPWR